MTVITLPEDSALKVKLERKLWEYRARLARANQSPHAPHRAADAIVKIAVLDTLLKNGVVNIEEIRTRLDRESETMFLANRLPDVFNVIIDYCNTGGTNVVGGTGLT